MLNVVSTIGRPQEGMLYEPSNPTLDPIWKEACNIQHECLDALVETPSVSAKLRLISGGVDPKTGAEKFDKTLAFTADSVEATGRHYDRKAGDYFMSQFTDFSFSQFCTKIGVPTRYMLKCEQSGKYDLLDKNVSTWLKDCNSPMFIRMYKDEIRGILGNRYSTFDAPDIIQELAHSSFIRSLSVKGVILDPTRLHIRFVSQERLDVEGEDLYPGITVNSSDVGMSSLRVGFFVFKQVCTNGLMLPITSSRLFVQKHIGISPQEFREGLRDCLTACADFKAEAQEILRLAVVTRSLTLKERENILKREQFKVLFSDDTIKEVLNIQGLRYTPNLWGLVNAITEYAQRFMLERRLMFETAAGKILTLKN